MTFSEIRFPASFSTTELKFAIGMTIPVFATAIVKGVLRADLFATGINLDDLIVGVAEGLGDVHQLKMPPAESLWSGQT
jgi:hypothetical protein